MSIWALLNAAAWGVSAVLLLTMLVDFVKVERKADADKRKKPDSSSPSDPT